MRLSILSLGPLQFVLDDAPLTGFISDKARALLAYLAIEQKQNHRRENLAGLLWPEYPEQKARHTLSQTLSSVRQLIGDRGTSRREPFLDVTRQTLAFNLASDYWLDITQFIVHSSQKNVTLQALEKTAALYRGHFIQGFSLGDSPAFEEWVLIQRERLQRIEMSILNHLVVGFTQERHVERALYYAWQLLDIDPWREDAHRQVIRLLAISGQRTASLAQYNICRQVLMDELGVEPEKETVALYEAVKSGKFAPEYSNVERNASFYITPPHNIPAQLTPLIGRETDLQYIRTLLLNPVCRLLTLCGPGGIGKTRLALETATSLIPSFKDGVYVISLATLKTTESIIPVIAQTLGFTFIDNGTSHEQQLLTYLKSKKLLLVLDNTEHLQHDTGKTVETTSICFIITAILEAAQHIKILATSRIRLNLLGEYLFAVHELPYPEKPTANIEELQNFPAIQLFMRSARRLRPDYAITANNSEAICNIFHNLQGIPLAIVLAASWTDTLSTADIATMLTGDVATPYASLDILTTDWQNLPDRHHSMRAVFEHSWQFLTAHEQDVFQALSVFRGGFTSAAAYTVGGATPHDLRKLIDGAFINRSSSGRYSVHELMRQFGGEKLARNEDIFHNIHEKHSTYFAEAFKRWREDVKGPQQINALNEIEIEEANARGAWDWSVAQGNFYFIDCAIKGLWSYYTCRNRYKEAETLCRMAIEKLELEENETPVQKYNSIRILSKLITWISYLVPDDVGRAYAERNLGLLEMPELVQFDFRAEKAAALRSIGDFLSTANSMEAINYFEQSLNLYREVGDCWEESFVLRELCFRHWCIGEFSKAQQYCEHGLAISLELGDLKGITKVKDRLGSLLMSMGDNQRAIRLLEESLQIRRQIGDKVEIANGLYSLAIKYIYRADYSQAISLLEESIEIYTYFGQLQGLEYAMLAWARMYLGSYEQAHNDAMKSYHLIMEKQKSIQNTGWTTFVLGSIALGQGEIKQAAEWLAQSVKTYRPLGQMAELSFALAHHVYAACLLEKIHEARQYLIEVMRIGTRIGAEPTLTFALAGAALWFFCRKDYVMAIELYALLTGIVHNKWIEDVIGHHIDDAAKNLPQSVVVAAQARGRGRDLHTTVKELFAELESVV